MQCFNKLRSTCVRLSACVFSLFTVEGCVRQQRVEYSAGMLDSCIGQSLGEATAKLGLDGKDAAILHENMIVQGAVWDLGVHDSLSMTLDRRKLADNSLVS